MNTWHEPTEISMVIPCDGVVTNLEFHDQGQYLAVTTNQSAIHFIDCVNGIEKKKIFAKKHGIGKLQFTHHDMCLLLSAQMGTQSTLDACYDIKHLCIYDNRYLRYFKGHTSDITSLSMNPVNDQFLSASYDNTVRLWDLSSATNIAKINLPFPSGPFHISNNTSPIYRPPLCAYDSTGLVFGILHHNTLKLYDARNYENGPFANIFPSMDLLKQALITSDPNMTDVQLNKYLHHITWTNFEFSSDAGNIVLLNTNSNVLYLLDGLNADNEPKAILSRKNETGQILGAAFSHDSKYIITGNDDNEIQYYDRESCSLKHTLQGHIAPVGKIKCNKVYDIMSTGCINAVIWCRKQMSHINFTF